MNILSIIIPLFNESDTIETLLHSVCHVTLIHQLEKEIIVVNDRSTDDSEIKVKQFIANNPSQNIQYHVLERNSGKGAAIRVGINHAKGDLIIIQDADLEYDPAEYNSLIEPVFRGFADVVYGSRFMGSKPHRVLFFWHTIGNRMISFMSNMFSNLNLTDIETCYKLFRSEIIKSVNLRENRFGFEPEVTAKIARIKGIRIYEVGISYYCITYGEGKKIKWKDGFRAIWCILKYGMFRCK